MPGNSNLEGGGPSSEGKGDSFRKRKLSLTNLSEAGSCNKKLAATPQQNAQFDLEALQTNQNEANALKLLHQSQHSQNTPEDDEKAHSFRKRRLSLTHKREDATLEDAEPNQRRRRHSDASASSLESSGAGGVVAGSPQKNAKRQPLKSRIVHASELLAHSPPSPMPSSDNRLYQQSAPPQRQALLDTIAGGALPKWKKRHTRHLHEDERKLPFPRDIVGTFSCHGIEPIYDDDYSRSDDEESNGKPTTAAKINQDRGGVAFPYGNCPKTALFAVYDGHGQGGELVAQFALHEVQSRLEKHADFSKDIEKAFKKTFLAVDESLKEEVLIEPLYAGTTACVALLRENRLVLANAGDSRAVLAKKTNSTWTALDLTKDQNPDLPEEQARIEGMGGHVSPPPEPGLSARVWFDVDCTQIGLAMARSLGDHAVKPIGVIAEPAVTFHDIAPDDDFVIFATDGVWEFISSDQAVQIVATNLERGATKACQALIEAAAGKWHDEEGDYRDDITALVVRLRRLWRSDEPGP